MHVIYISYRDDSQAKVWSSSVNQVGSFIGTVLKKKKTFKLAYDNYIIFFTNEVQSLPVLEPF
jgi:hypothetical protein